MSPEQHAGLDADRRSDIFSCGVVLYELLTGSKPFEGPPETTGERICRGPYRPASELNPKGSPASLDAVIARALAKKPEERFPTARDFAGELEAAFKEGSDAQRDVGADEQSSVTIRSDTTVALSSSLRLRVEDLRAIEALLAVHVGPMAKVLLKQSAKTAGGGPALVSALAKYIPSEAGRMAFLAAAMERMSAAVPPGRGDEGPTVRFSRNLIDAAQVETAAKRLARFLGPIAKVIAKKTPGRPSDLRAYYQQLAENILDEADRARFLKDAGYGK
jgi:eukaryotic-like serine/threonine-protein kinase